VTILDDLGNPVAGATVTGSFTGHFNESGVADVTDANGVAVLITAGSLKGRLNFEFCVDDVTETTLTYDPSANVATCDSF
jgi:uncharacterized GH25 family protein